MRQSKIKNLNYLMLMLNGELVGKVVKYNYKKGPS